MSTDAKDVVVIGAGIVGSMISYLLCRRGLSVTLMESSPLGSHASGLAFGGLDPLNGVGVPEPLLDFSLFCFGRQWSIAREFQARRVSTRSSATGTVCTWHLMTKT